MSIEIIKNQDYTKLEIEKILNAFRALNSDTWISHCVVRQTKNQSGDDYSDDYFDITIYNFKNNDKSQPGRNYDFSIEINSKTFEIITGILDSIYNESKTDRLLRIGFRKEIHKPFETEFIKLMYFLNCCNIYKKVIGLLETELCNWK